jgi:hypothetical protein
MRIQTIHKLLLERMLGPVWPTLGDFGPLKAKLFRTLYSCLSTSEALQKTLELLQIVLRALLG